MNALEINNLSKNYKDFSLRDVCLSLPKGCTMGLIGENGAGKSTIMKLILNMEKKDGGEIKIFGEDNATNQKEHKEIIGYVSDEVGLPSYLNAQELGRVMALSYKNWDMNMYNTLLKKFSLPKDKKYNDFSRGMKMKLSIATALSHNPKLLLLDEATSGLDPLARDEITDIWSSFTRDENKAVLISSHIVSDIEKLSDYVAFISHGRVFLCDEKDALKEKYGLIHANSETLATVPKESLIYIKENPYGSEAIIKRDRLLSSIEVRPVGLEELFIFMLKGEENK